MKNRPTNHEALEAAELAQQLSAVLGNANATDKQGCEAMIALLAATGLRDKRANAMVIDKLEDVTKMLRGWREQRWPTKGRKAQ